MRQDDRPAPLAKRFPERDGGKGHSECLSVSRIFRVLGLYYDFLIKVLKQVGSSELRWGLGFRF